MSPSAAHGPRSARVVGRGRAGGSFTGALRAAGWSVDLIAHDDPAVRNAAAEADLVLLCVPDAVIAAVAEAIDPDPSGVVAHCAGAATLQVLGRHPRRASVHPLVSLADPVLGARQLHGAWFAVAGDRIAVEVVEALDGRFVEVDDADRVRYHAAAVVASNHLVALLGQVERIAGGIGVPLEAFLDLSRGSIDNVATLGPASALTGPVARGDLDTVRSHLAALPESEREAYLALARAAARLVGTSLDLGEQSGPPPAADDAGAES